MRSRAVPTHHEPDRGRRNWKDKPAEQDAVYGNRRRIRGQRGKRLMRKRGELVERSFAHAYDTGGMRRTHLKRHGNILKRLLIHVAGFNLSLILRTLLGFGTARSLQGRAGRFVDGFFELWRHCTGGSARRRTRVMLEWWIRSVTRSAA
ncbi:MAG: transposase [Planctomycetes bacterium]|nr:transposase [Planctomycetota bacterium]